jgi:glycosyltransferase involved in cell wall biosynthesis
MSAPLVSVIIPCYNAAPWVGDAIRSVIEQSYDRVEVVVVDDGSDDNSPAVVQSVIDDVSDGNGTTGRIRLLQQENAGPSAARNRGIAASEGCYLLFLDADDLLLPNAVETHLSTMRDFDADATVSDWVNFHHETGREQPVSAAFRFPEDPLASLLYQPMHTSAAMVPRTDRRWDESMMVNEVFDYFFGLFPDMSIAYTGETGSRVRHGHSDTRITEIHDHWETSARIELMTEYKHDLQSEGRLTPLREAVIDYKQLTRLYAGLRRGEDIRPALARIDVARSKLPSYDWFNPLGLAGFSYLFGVQLGPRLFYWLNTALNRT